MLLLNFSKNKMKCSIDDVFKYKKWLIVVHGNVEVMNESVYSARTEKSISKYDWSSCMKKL